MSIIGEMVSTFIQTLIYGAWFECHLRLSFHFDCKLHEFCLILSAEIEFAWLLLIKDFRLLLLFVLSCPSQLSDFARPVVNHPPTEWVKSGYVRLCCVDCTTLVEVGLGLDIGLVLTDIRIRAFPTFHSLLTM